MSSCVHTDPEPWYGSIFVCIPQILDPGRQLEFQSPNLPTNHSLVIDLFRAYYMPSNERHWKETKCAAVIAATLQRDKLSLSDLNQRNKSAVYSIIFYAVVLKETVIGKPRVNPLLSVYLKWWNGTNRVVTSVRDGIFELSDHIVLCLYVYIYI